MTERWVLFFSWDNMESTDYCSLLLKWIDTVLLNCFQLCTCSYHKATSLTHLFLVWRSLCGNVSPNHFVVMHTQILRKFIFYALQTRTADNPFHQQCDLKILPFSAGCSTICFPFYPLMVTSLLSVPPAMRDTVVADKILRAECD